MTDRAIELLEEQQRKVKERSAPWLVAEQLKDICRREPHSADAGRFVIILSADHDE